MVSLFWCVERQDEFQIMNNMSDPFIAVETPTQPLLAQLHHAPASDYGTYLPMQG